MVLWFFSDAERVQSCNNPEQDLEKLNYWAIVMKVHSSDELIKAEAVDVPDQDNTGKKI